MNITELLSTERVARCNDVGSKKRLLEQLSELLAGGAPGLSDNEIFEALINREKLGSTGLGKGLAIPHGRLDNLDYPICAFIKLDEAVDFDASDGEPVDLVFALLVPTESTEEHLHVLSTIAEIFSSPVTCSALRNCQSSDCLLDQICKWESQRIPA